MTEIILASNLKMYLSRNGPLPVSPDTEVG